MTIAVYAKKNNINKAVAFHEVLPQKVVVTQVKPGIFLAESRWHGTGMHPNELVFKKMSCKNGVTVNETNVKGVFADRKHVFELSVPKHVKKVVCTRGIVDISSFKNAFEFKVPNSNI
ncbi:16481_t:CDS:2 [Cetraspora pellucida]|uniref:16481_t:CDS:1 n=1 Tax=Cetraspora pellucida TaxID=1433469 RepID=A0A9N8ZD01_9GLOM|nr:16481_t:CDS:2 [Cetraspora pellucida]